MYFQKNKYGRKTISNNANRGEKREVKTRRKKNTRNIQKRIKERTRGKKEKKERELQRNRHK